MGHLGFACKVVQTGKTFLRLILELLSVQNLVHSWVRLNASSRSNLLWWYTLLAPFNGINLTCTLAPHSFQVMFALDASESIGCGVMWSPRYKWCEYLASVASLQDEDSITLKCGIWGPA